MSILDLSMHDTSIDSPYTAVTVGDVQQRQFRDRYASRIPVSRAPTRCTRRLHTLIDTYRALATAYLDLQIGGLTGLRYLCPTQASSLFASALFDQWR